MNLRKVFAATIVAATLFGSAGIALAAPYDFEATTRNGTDTADVPTNITPPCNQDGDHCLMGFKIDNGGIGYYQYFLPGSGIGFSGNVFYVTPDSMEYSSGVSLRTTIDAKASAASVSSVSSSLSSLSALESADALFASNANANLFGTSTTMTSSNASTTSFLMSRAQLTTLNNLSASAAWSWSSPSHSLTTSTGAAGFQISSTRNSTVRYNVKVTTTASIAGNADGYETLEVAPTNSATAGDWVEIGRCGNSQALTLAITLQSVQGTTCELTGDIPAGYYAKLRSVTTTGTVAFAYVSGQEVLK